TQAALLRRDLLGDARVGPAAGRGLAAQAFESPGAPARLDLCTMTGFHAASTLVTWRSARTATLLTVVHVPMRRLLRHDHARTPGRRRPSHSARGSRPAPPHTLGPACAPLRLVTVPPWTPTT